MADRAPDHTVQVRELFDAKAMAWPSKYAQNGRLAGRLTRLASAITCQVPAGGRVLDFGCGTGEIAGAVAAAGLRVTGCDISPEMLRLAAATSPSGVADWVQLEPGWRKLPFKPETFDAVIASSVLEYVDDPMAVLAECRRVLVRDGVVLSTVPNLYHPVRCLERVAGVAARAQLARAQGRRWARLGSYLTYLQTSRQRHTFAWWRETAEHVGLRMVPSPTGQQWRESLLLLTLRRCDIAMQFELRRESS